MIFLTFDVFALAHKIEKRYRKSVTGNYLPCHTESKSALCYVTVTLVTWLHLVTVSKDKEDIKCGTSLQTHM